MIISIGAQIEEVKREIEMRLRVYSRQVMKGQMRGSIADMHIDRMKAVLETLRDVERQQKQ